MRKIRDRAHDEAPVTAWILDDGRYVLCLNCSRNIDSYANMDPVRFPEGDSAHIYCDECSKRLTTTHDCIR